MEGLAMSKIMGILNEMPDWLQVILTMLGAVVVLATCIVRLTPNKKDDEVMGKVEKMFVKLLMFLPTLGINPKTKEMMESLEEAKLNIKVKPDDAPKL